MKRKLIFIMAVALTTLIIRAGVNPRIVKVNLDIDGMADGPAEFGTALEPGGPGGFVAKDGWKKIKLSVEGAGSARLNWNSDKIGVYQPQGQTLKLENKNEGDRKTASTTEAAFGGVLSNRPDTHPPQQTP